MSIKIGGMEIKPEIEQPLYWVHLLILVLIVYFLVNQFVQPMEITMKNIGLGVIFLGIADITAHSVLKLN